MSQIVIVHLIAESHGIPNFQLSPPFLISQPRHANDPKFIAPGVLDRFKDSHLRSPPPARCQSQNAPEVWHLLARLNKTRGG